MNSKHLPENTSRFEGCTVMGALSVSAFLDDAVTIVHGPDGCTHINTSLLHTTLLEHDIYTIPRIISSGLGEEEVIFGGEEALAEAIAQACSSGPSAVCVISTCVTETIGDDTAAVCARDWEVPVVHIESSGFLGGTFHSGYSSALFALADFIEPSPSRDRGVNLIGEKNLEFEVEANYAEVARLLGALGLEVNVRFVRNVSPEEIRGMGAGCLNVMREDPQGILSAHFDALTGIPSIPVFPAGLAGTIAFLGEVGGLTGIDASDAIREEEARQEELAGDFSDLAGACITFDSFGFQSAGNDLFEEIAEHLGIHVSPEGTVIPVPFCMPVGTSGIRAMLRQWRRFINGQTL